MLRNVLMCFLCRAGSRNINQWTWTKKGNGVYRVPFGTPTVDNTLYVIFDKHDVIVTFYCTPRAPGVSENNPLFFTAIEIRKKAFKTPLDREVQAAMDEAVAMVKEKPDIFGEISSFRLNC